MSHLLSSSCRPALSAESKVSFSGFVVALDKQAFADGSAGMKWGEVIQP